MHISIPCPICGMGETGTHNHYGGRACTSCRAFFRRSVQTNSYKVSKFLIHYIFSFSTIKQLPKHFRFCLQNFKCQNSGSKGNESSTSKSPNIKPQLQSNELSYHNGADLLSHVKNTSNSKNEDPIKRNGYVRQSWGTFECRIDSRSWKSCRFCRFNKCIASGMRPGR